MATFAGRAARASVSTWVHLGPDDLLLAARVDLADGLDSDGVETVSARISADLQDRLPGVAQIFLDITDATDDDRDRARRRLATLADTGTQLDR